MTYNDQDIILNAYHLTHTPKTDISFNQKEKNKTEEGKEKKKKKKRGENQKYVFFRNTHVFQEGLEPEKRVLFSWGIYFLVPNLFHIFNATSKFTYIYGSLYIKISCVNAESTSRKLFAWSDSSRPIKQEERETDPRIEIRSRTSGSKISGIHSKRNHTIGLGELEQFDLLVTESVIRWASCTRIPTATSLRPSAVC